MITTVGYTLSGLIAAGIIVIGARFIVAPRVASAGYGVPADPDQHAIGAYLSVKGVRDIASGLVVIVLLVAGAAHLLGWMLVAATVIPVADAVIVHRNGGPTSISLGIHGATAAVMLVTAALLLLS
ncbi:hypothetical protein CRM90_01070 [Mycobacterium sp. ENV421]|uniref:DUF4267 domain-containing protein n=1 Tax=Mycobacterium sp. ENV421 TaxID=1213407 RepID=UPI000C9B1284|nr:DUF4267 domain-containing protein [Mycobacterium sp. ENV421]PND59600.1 hypothetical protein CRM90_01070 [Mycobacterium sp. ENV421]